MPMKKTLTLLSFLLILHTSGFSQTTNCATAINQLQNYAAGVNRMYNYEYWTAIPGQRCPAYDAWGRPFNPVAVQNCRQQMLYYLNQWYASQCNYVNRTYVQISQSCLTEQPETDDNPAPDPVDGSDEGDKINTGKIKDLTAGVDEDKAVRITIPKNPTGFKPR